MACPSHRFDVITTSCGPSASGRGPATARGTIVAPSASAATPATSATPLRRRISASTTGSGDVSAAYGVNAISATSGYGTSTPSTRSTAHPTQGNAKATAIVVRTRPNLKGSDPFR